MDLDELKRLEQTDEGARSIEEAVAIARGHEALVRADLAALVGMIEGQPALLQERATLARLHGFIERESVALEALEAVARLPGPEAMDLLHATWRGRKHTVAGLLARDLVRRGAALEQASAPLRVAIEIEQWMEARPEKESRRERWCERARGLLERAAEKGDRRCAPSLASMASRRGCGGDGEGDCYPCLRAGDELARAMEAVRTREAPAPWILPR